MFAVPFFMAMPLTLAAQPYSLQTLNFQVARGINNGIFGLEIVGDNKTLMGSVSSPVVVPYSDPGSTVVNRNNNNNNNNNGDLVGTYTLNGVRHGFFFSLKLNQILPFNNVDYPMSSTSEPLGIDDNGVIVGHYVDAFGNSSGYFLDSSGYNPVSCAANLYKSFSFAGFYGVVGDYLDSDGTPHGVLVSPPSEACVQVDVPGSIGTSLHGINGAGQVVGQYKDVLGNWHGFVAQLYFDPDLLLNVVNIDYPGASFTSPMDINDFGRIVGYFGTEQSVANLGTVTNFTGFIAVPGPTGLLGAAGGTVEVQVPGLPAPAKIKAPQGASPPTQPWRWV